MINEERLSRIPFFRNFGPKDLQIISEIVYQQKIAQGSVIFNMDEVGRNMFLIEKGSVDVTLDIGQHECFVLAAIEEGDFFGEMAILEDSTRAATVVARENLTVLVLNRLDLFATIDKDPDTAYLILKTMSKSLSLRLRLLDEHFVFTEGIVKTLHVLKETGQYHERYPDIALARECEMNLIELLKDRSEVQSHAEGSIIVREGDLQRELFIIKKGTAEVSKQLPDTDRVKLAVLGVNSIFGEMSFLDWEIRSAQVKALQPMEILVFTNEHLQELARDDIALLNQLYFNILRRQCLNVRLTNKLYCDAKRNLIDLTSFKTM